MKHHSQCNAVTSSTTSQERNNYACSCSSSYPPGHPPLTSPNNLSRLSASDRKKFKSYSQTFSIVVLAATFEATLFIAYLTLTSNIHEIHIDGDSLRNFRFGFFAVILSISAAALAAVNTALFSLLSSEEPGSRHLLAGIPKVMYEGSVSFFLCVVCLLSAGCCFILGAFFFLRRFDPLSNLALSYQWLLA